MRAAIWRLTTALVLSLAGSLQGQGLEFADPTAYQSIPLASTPLMGELPASADLSARFPTPGNQGQQSSCVGWAVAYALKSYQETVERGWSPTTPDRLFSPSFIYNQIRQSPNCRGGTSLIDALNLVRRDGVAPLSSFPYAEGSCSAIPGEAVKQVARHFAISDWRRVNVQDETEVKNHIAAGFPVLIGMVYDQAFQNLRGPQTYAQFSGQSLGGHAMVVVGYDDARRSFKVINSWGTGWGDQGFGWISYTAFRQATREGYVAQDIVAQHPPTRPSTTPPTVEPPRPATAPVVQVGAVQARFNVPVTHPAGLAPGPGMEIQVPGSVSNAAGKTLQIVIRFAFQNGSPLFANQQEPSFRDVNGMVATGTAPVQVTADRVGLGGYRITIPYYALNLQPTNGAMTYQLQMSATVYLDNFVVGQSAWAPFHVRW